MRENLCNFKLGRGLRIDTQSVIHQRKKMITLISSAFFLKSFSLQNIPLRGCKNKLQIWRNLLAKGQNLDYIKNSQNSMIKKSKKLITKWSKDVKRHFTGKNIQMASKHMKRCFTSNVIRELWIRAKRYRSLHTYRSS